MNKDFSESTDIFVIEKNEEDIRIDKYLSLKYPDKSRSYFQYLLKNHLILLNGKPVKKRIKPKEGDEIEICFAVTPEISLEAQDIPLDILYEDEHILAINKPKKMVVHPAPGHYSGTFVNALLFHCKNLPNKDDSLRPGIVHRLDKDTTGVLLAAKTLESHQQLIKLFSDRKIEKTYLAICGGKPQEGSFSAPICRHPYNRKKMMVCDEKGKEAISTFSILAHEKNLSLVRVGLETGRTHQIRVHLKHQNCPIIGDESYGSDSLNRTYGIDSQLLHAYEIRFIHPMTKKELTIQAPVPLEMKTFLQKNFSQSSIENIPCLSNPK